MRLRLGAALALAVALVGAVALAPEHRASAQPTGDLLNDIPVTGALADGGTFSGLLDITGLAIQNGQLVASGVLTGTATQPGTVTELTQTFTGIPVSLLQGGRQARCDILNLDLGPIFLDLLGLELDLSAIELDLTAVRGPGNLLGNLLCAVTGLLDGPNLGGLQGILDVINRLLGSLGGGRP